MDLARRLLAMGLWLLILVVAGGLLAWNAGRFVGTKQVPRMKDLSFLPPPVVAKALALGQGTALAKLRWIDSFAYFEYQIGHKDDTVAGSDGRGGFARLYETLIALDPRFVPFYEQAVLNTSGILTDHRSALGFALGGTLEMPQEQGLWRIAAAELAVNFSWTKRNPAGLDGFLRGWADSERSPEDKQRVWEWRRGLAFQNVDGLETLPWWLEQMRTAKPGTPLYGFVTGTVRELLATHAVHLLPELLSPTSTLLGVPHLDPDRVAARFPHGIPGWEPVLGGPGGPRLRNDPFGWPFRIVDGKVVSPGLEQRRFLTIHQPACAAIANEAAKRGRPAHDAAEAREWTKAELPAPPDGGRWSFAGETPVVVWPDPPGEPWSWR